MATYKVWMQIEMQRNNGTHKDMGEPESVSFSRPSEAKDFVAHADSYHEILSDKSNLATILAALRLFQNKYVDCDGDTIAGDWPNHFTREDGTLLPPLSTEDIDLLCEELNG